MRKVNPWCEQDTSSQANVMLPLVKIAPLGGEVRFGDGQLEGGAVVIRN